MTPFNHTSSPLVQLSSLSLGIVFTQLTTPDPVPLHSQIAHSQRPPQLFISGALVTSGLSGGRIRPPRPVKLTLDRASPTANPKCMGLGEFERVLRHIVGWDPLSTVAHPRYLCDAPHAELMTLFRFRPVLCPVLHSHIKHVQTTDVPCLVAPFAFSCPVVLHTTPPLLGVLLYIPCVGSC